jgi:acyl carrier protein
MSTAMIKFLKSIFAGESSEKEPDASADRLETLATGGATPAGSDGAEASPPASPSVRGFTREQIITDLVAQVCTTMPDPRPFEEIDTNIHMYDAGYVTSITAADLLAHIESRYGVDISETKLIGPLQNLEALATHIESEST